MSAGRNELIEALTRLRNAGVSFSINASNGWLSENGDLSFYLSPAEAVKYLTDPDSVTARHSGVSVAELREWREAGGYSRCHALTSQGERCRHCAVGQSKAGYSQKWNPAEWAAFDRLGHCCARHGGARGQS